MGGHPLGASKNERQGGLSTAGCWRAPSLGMLVKDTSRASTTSYGGWVWAGLQTGVSRVSALRKEHHFEAPVNSRPPASRTDGAGPGSADPTLMLTAPEPRGPPKGQEHPEVKPSREADSRSEPPPAALAPAGDASAVLVAVPCRWWQGQQRGDAGASPEPAAAAGQGEGWQFGIRAGRGGPCSPAGGTFGSARLCQAARLLPLPPLPNPSKPAAPRTGILCWQRRHPRTSRTKVTRFHPVCTQSPGHLSFTAPEEPPTAPRGAGGQVLHARRCWRGRLGPPAPRLAAIARFSGSLFWQTGKGGGGAGALPWETLHRSGH